MGLETLVRNLMWCLRLQLPAGHSGHAQSLVTPGQGASAPPDLPARTCMALGWVSLQPLRKCLMLTSFRFGGISDAAGQVRTSQPGGREESGMETKKTGEGCVGWGQIQILV